MASAAFSADTTSPGFMMTRLGSTRLKPTPSMVLCEIPTSPHAPSRPMNFTLNRSTRMLWRTWFSARPMFAKRKLYTTGIKPSEASAPATTAPFCSAMPTWTMRSGMFSVHQSMPGNPISSRTGMILGSFWAPALSAFSMPFATGAGSPISMCSLNVAISLPSFPYALHHLLTPAQVHMARLPMGNPVSLHRVRDDALGLIVGVKPVGQIEHVENLSHVMTVDLSHPPAKGLPLICQRLDRHDVVGGAVQAPLVVVDNGDEVV